MKAGDPGGAAAGLRPTGTKVDDSNSGSTFAGEDGDGDQAQGGGAPGQEPASPPMEWSAAPVADSGSRSGGRRGWLWPVATVAAVAIAGGGFGIGLLAHGSPGSQPIPKPAATSGQSAPSGSLDVAAIAARAERAVVDITAVDGYANATSAGTGMILTSNGEVLTNNHVIDGATSLSARIDGNGAKYQAKVIGYDATDDVALIQLEGASGLPTVSVGNSSTVRVGDRVVAIGNALDLPGKPTVTTGTISALDRSITASDQGSGSSEQLSNMLQTDAPLQSGDSGGPLVNTRGQVIGMDTANESAPQTAAASTVGFAIPINRALAIASQMQRGQAGSGIHIGLPAFIGVDVEDASAAGSSPLGPGGSSFGPGYTPPVSSGALVLDVLPNTPAQAAGLQPGDVISAVNGVAVSGQTQLRDDLSHDRPGQSVSLTWVEAGGSSHTSTVTLIAGPAD